MQKYVVYAFYRIGTHLHQSLFWGVLVVFLLLLFHSTSYYERLFFRVTDNDAVKAAAIVATPQFKDGFNRVVYLKQGWSQADSLWFYNTTQGSDLLPYDFFLYLEQKDSKELFRSAANIDRFRYLPQNPTWNNPDGLPLGMVADEYQCKKYMGFTCAACHTAQVTYKGVAMRIDGGPGAADMDGFMRSLEDALAVTRDNPEKRQRFVAAVLKSGNYSTETEIINDLKVYALRMEAYNFFNKSYIKDAAGARSDVPYGYARLDAFGRIYNRVLEHVLNPEALQEILAQDLPPNETKALLARLQPVLSSANRDHLMERLVALLPDLNARVKLRDAVFNPPNAPVSYPFLWDIPRHDFVQWNGIGANAGVGPIGRNAGEVIGVFGTLDWEEKPGWTLYSVLGGQGFGDKHIDFKSSVNVHNLRQLEDRLWTLESPTWRDATETAGLPPIDQKKASDGKVLFEKNCAACHAVIERSSENRRIVAHMDGVDVAKTDAQMANNSVKYDGYSGILRNLYTKTDVGGILLNTRAPVAAILTTATENVVATPDPDKWFFTRFFDWLVDLKDEYFQNKIKPSVKSGDYTPDSTARPYESLRSYKGRALNGIWATAPYLHNGSVPTLYDLLLPASERPKQFLVGSRELDPVKVGHVSALGSYDGFLFDTTKPVNSNAGHEYGTNLTDEERWALVEYMKTL
ncbi:MAG TPA: di-heme-cytochrome C peroxidase [Bryobacteraceae bacterium]|nr:di-heme-cytochrome C peroxidase [Bryobacteraceae bacterium]